MTQNQRDKMLKAKVAVSLHHATGRVPTSEEIEQVALLARVLYHSVLGTHFRRKTQQAAGQLPIF